MEQCPYHLGDCEVVFCKTRFENMEKQIDALKTLLNNDRTPSSERLEWLEDQAKKLGWDGTNEAEAWFVEQHVHIKNELLSIKPRVVSVEAIVSSEYSGLGTHKIKAKK